MSSKPNPRSQDDILHAAEPDWIHDVLRSFDITSDDQDFFTDILLSRTVLQGDLHALVASRFGSDQLHKAQEIISNIFYHDVSSLRWTTSEQLASQLQYHTSWQKTDSLIALAKAHRTQPWLSTGPTPLEQPWLETDRLIAQAKGLQEQALDVQTSALSPLPLDGPTSTQSTTPKKRKRKQDVASHFWGGESEDSIEPREHVAAFQPFEFALSPAKQPFLETPHVPKVENSQPAGVGAIPKTEPEAPGEEQPLNPNLSARVLRGHRKASPYFMPPTPPTPPPSAQKSPPKRRPAGTVSCMPFPPLDTPSFGLVQSKVAHEPFWLLVVVTFLIKTKGKTAVPVFWDVKKRFPTPEDLANPDNADELLVMMRHLGLAKHRLGILQKFGRIWKDNPPAAGKVHRVRNYDRRDLPSYPEVPGDKLEDAAEGGMQTPKKDVKVTAAEAWEIGHLTAGKYALDSWRIFCRDVLLGRAEGWNGEGARGEFQPEWCRVRPTDKELRAYLRWMWMREGFEWDPVTGEQTALRPEMMKAVNEGRVEWDDTGSLRIVEEPRQDEDAA